MLKKKFLYIALTTVCMLILSACSSDESSSSTPEKEKEEKEEKQEEKKEKTPIDLTVGIIGESPSLTRAATRTVITDNENANKFDAGTSLYMVMMSEDVNNSNPKYTRTIGYAQEEKDANNTYVKFGTNYKRYWEDAYPTSNARDTKITVYSACVPGYRLSGTEIVSSNVSLTGSVDDTKWEIGGSNVYTYTSNDNMWSNASGAGSTTIAWPLRSGDDANVTKQTQNFITSQDLCFSNNVSKYGTTDNRLQFSGTSIPTRRMIFYHALAKITFRIKKGDGFESSDAFEFSNTNENIVLKGFNTSGTFDIKEGEFQSTTSSNDITSMACQKDVVIGDNTYAYVLDALMLPGSELTGTETDKIYFTIDNNKYHITKDQLKTALNGKTLSDNNTTALDNDNKMRPGVHYIFTMTVGKQKMDHLMASVVSWEQVEATTTPTNARIKLDLLERGTQQTGTSAGEEAEFSLYRSPNTGEIDDTTPHYDWETGYVDNKGKLVWDNSENVYVAKDADNDKYWYWPDNKTYYHFRTVKPKTLTVQNDSYDYFELTGGSTDDLCWGAPFYNFTNSADKLYYDKTKGFAEKDGNKQISKAIGPTTYKIKMVMFNMMSKVTIKVETTTDDDKVELDDSHKAKLSLSQIYPTGRVKMGNGLVVTTGTPGPVEKTSNEWTRNFVPQSLDNVVLTITTTDNNQYEVNMKDVVASSVSNNLIENPYSANKIDHWYPNYEYTYKFILKKTGVAKVTATISNWESVPAAPQEVKIK